MVLVLNTNTLSLSLVSNVGFIQIGWTWAHVKPIATESLNNETSISIQQLQEKDHDLML